MQPIAAFLIAEHIHDLLREAELATLERAAARASGRPRRWRRRVARGMRRMSGALAALARRLDPALARSS
jgi:hypothetical protein